MRSLFFHLVCIILPFCVRFFCVSVVRIFLILSIKASVLYSASNVCPEDQMKSCIEVCQIRCQNIEIRPFVNPTGLLRVSFNQCVSFCHDACRKTDDVLTQELKTPQQPLAHFVLKMRQQEGCHFKKLPPSRFALLWQKIKQNVLYMVARLVGKSRSTERSGGLTSVITTQKSLKPEGDFSQLTLSDLPEDSIPLPLQTMPVPKNRAGVPLYVSPQRPQEKK